MLYQLAPYNKEISYLFSNINNNSLDEKNILQKHLNNKINSFFLPSFNNSESNLKNESFYLSNECHIDYSIQSDIPTLIKNQENKEDIKIPIKKEVDYNKDIIKNQINDNNIQKENKIFNIQKSIKLGRIKKYSCRIGKHDKYKRDNIKNILNFVNSCFLINHNFCTKSSIKVIKKSCSCKVKLISKEENLKCLDTKLKYIFSYNVSKKIGNCDINFNKMLIKRIYEKGEEKKVIFILEKTVREMWHIYVHGSNDKNFIGFKTLQDDLKSFKENGESDIYIEEYKHISFDFERIFTNIIGRKKRRIRE